jgi:hypothetical protein
MKRSVLAMVAVSLATVAQAWTNAITATNAGAPYGAIVVPPVFSGASRAQLLTRTTNLAVAVGDRFLIGTVPCVATCSGIVTTATVVTVTVRTNGLGVVTTNTTTVVQPITVPTSGRSAIDGSVYWMRMPAARSRVPLQVAIGGSAACSVVLTDGGGVNFWSYSATANDVTTFDGYQGALYAYKDGTNTCTLTAWQW